jgi:hypothetical protein
MARINTYQIDGSISANDIVIGSEYNGINSTGIPIYKTKNYRMSDLQTFLAGGDFEFAAPITIQTLPAGNKKWVHDTQSLTSTSSSVTLYAKDNYAENTPETFSSVTGVTTNTTGHLTGYVLTTFTMPEEYSFNVIGDASVNHSGSGSVDSQSQTINFEQTLTISGGDAWISTLSLDSAVDKVSIYHNDVSRTNASISPNKQLEDDSTFKAAAPVSNTDSNGVTTTTDAVISDDKGHVIKEQIHTYILPDYKFNIAADSTNNPAVGDPAFTTSIDIHSTSGTALDTLNILASAPISSIITDNDTITISHDEVSALIVTPAATDAPSFGGNFIALKSVDRDATGHLTHSIPVTVTIPDTVFVGSTAAVPGGAAASGGSVGLVPAPASTDILKFLRSDGNWNMPLSYTISTSNVAGNASSNPVVIAGATIGITDGTNTSSIKIQQGANVNIGSSAGIITISSTDTSYSVFTETVAGLVPAPTSSNTAKFLRGDATWANVTQTSITTTDGTFIDLTPNSATSGSVTVTADLSATGIGSTTAAKQIQFLRGDNTWSNVNNATLENIGGLRLFNNTHPANTINTATTVNGRFYGLQTSGASIGLVNVPWTDTNTQNTTTLSFVDSTNDIILRNTTGGAGSGNQDIKFVAGSNIALTHTNANNITIASTYSYFTGATNSTFGSPGLVPAPGYGENALFLKSNGTWASTPDTNTTYSPGAGIDLSGTTFSLTQTTNTANTYYRIPFMSNNVINIDDTTSHFSFNPSTDGLTVGKIGVGVTPFANSLSSSSNIDLIGNGGILSYTNNLYLTSNAYYDSGWKAKTTGTTSLLITRPSSLEYHVDTSGQSAGAATSFSQVFTVYSSGNVVATGHFSGTNFKIASDKRLKSEIEPIKEGLEVIKQFTSYNYIKGGEKESGFIAQEVREAIPHTVYENNDGYLSMSDRGVVAHMHKAILELEERLIAIEEKLK